MRDIPVINTRVLQSRGFPSSLKISRITSNEPIRLLLMPRPRPRPLDIINSEHISSLIMFHLFGSTPLNIIDMKVISDKLVRLDRDLVDLRQMINRIKWIEWLSLSLKLNTIRLRLLNISIRQVILRFNQPQMKCSRTRSLNVKVLISKLRLCCLN